MTAKQVAEWIENLVPGRPLGSDEGFRWGNPLSEVSGIVVSWMATVEVIERAAAEGCNLLIVHEQLTYPYSFMGGTMDRHLSWRSNQARLGRLAKGDIVVFRAHGMLDAYCILDDFAAALKLPPAAVKEQFYRVYDIEPVTVAELAGQVRTRLAMAGVRVVGDMQRVVQRVGLPWGGLGLSLNAAFLEGLLSYEPDVFIAGETDEYAMFLARDVGVPLIETSHVVSENIGLRRVAADLAAAFPEVKVVFHEIKCPWTLV